MSGRDEPTETPVPESVDRAHRDPVRATRTETLPPSEEGGEIAQPGFAGALFSNRYTIHDELGAGGFAVVYRAWDRELRREVALKILRADQTTPNAIRRLRREAALARDVESPHLIRIFELGEHVGLSYLVLELLPGGSLGDRIHAGPLPVAEVLRIGRELLLGLRALHGAGVVHRDLKPSNVLFGAHDEVKLADLGVALPLDPGETRTTRTNALVGTVDYLSPEQGLGQDAGPRSDLYSLGVLLFEALTGELPFPQEDGYATLVTRLRRRATPARRVRSDTPRWLSRFLARLLEADPRRRYPSAEAALADLERHRGPLRPAWRRIALGGLALAVITALAWRALPHGGRFRQLRPLSAPGASGLEAVDAEGRVLWKSEEMSRGSLRLAKLARLAAGAKPLLVTIPFRPRDHSPLAIHELALLDPDTGALVDRIALRLSAGSPFPTYSDWYWPEKLTVLDLDDDGIDEILVSYNHYRSWPSYTILYEPALHRPRYVYLAGGHSSFEAARDLDGDGRRDLVFSGSSSALGSYPALSAVRLEPSVGDDPGRHSGYRLAVAPGVGRFAEGRRALLWFRLLADPEFGQNDRRIVVEDRDRTLRIPYFSRPEGRFGFLGNRAAEPAAAPWGQSEPTAAEVAWLALEEALRLQAAGDGGAAWREIERALDAARATPDSLLVECVRRFRARLAIALATAVDGEGSRSPDPLLREILDAFAADATDDSGGSRRAEPTGDDSERVVSAAGREFERLFASSGFASEVAFDAAREHHLAGRLEEAIAWYREGTPSRFRLGLGGQDRLYFLQGTVFALVELGRFDDALREIESFDATFTRASSLDYDPISELLRFFVAWRRGAPCPPFSATPSTPITDNLGLLNLEWRRESGEPAAPLLAAVIEERQRATRTRGALLALEAELLAHLDRAREARALVEEGISQLRVDARADPTARVFLAVAVERAERLRTLDSATSGN